MPKLTRRAAASALAATGLVPSLAAQAAAPKAIELNWLANGAPPPATGVSFGVPFPRGTVRREQTFRLSAGEAELPLQSWPLAYWPDGSLKWCGFATVAASAAPSLRLTAASTTARGSLRVHETAGGIEIDTGVIQCRLFKTGPDLVESIAIDGRAVAARGRLSAMLEDRSQLASNRTVRFQDFTSLVRKTTVEQSGPVRATVKYEGVHKADSGSREWLPFVVRLYFYSGSPQIRVVHTIIFDGDEQKDFLRGVGVTFQIPLREQPHNRHIRFSGENGGLWAEPLQPITGRRPLAGNHYAAQLAGQRVPNKETFNAAGQKLLADWAIWDSFKLVQSSADGYSIQKRAHKDCCWLDAAAGRRASGLVFAGDVSGGLSVAVKNFWQSHPASLEVENATTPEATLRAWLWSPDAPAMDLRHYDVKAHDLNSSYEDVQEGFSTPHGIARTSELLLIASAAVPTREETVQQARLGFDPPLLVASPHYLHSMKAFGIWSLPDRSNPTKRAVEDQLDAGLALYQKEVEQRHWYGFWDYGDVMHAYDAPRHSWRYDIGGFAWDNTELGTDLWLWYSFLRTGRADVFRMAEAMTRHTSEVDCYHLGRFALLGSRHNVRHWGCGAKELRISQAAYRRFHYYLTTDERTGDLMREVIDSDSTLTKLDPMRLARPLSEVPSSYPARIRGGPDWLAAVGNWMTEWERTGNTKYRDKIIAGMDSIAQFPYGFLSGPEQLYGYDPATGKMHPLVKDGFGGYNLTTIMGGAQVIFELNEILDHAGWKKAWLQYCRLERAPKQVVATDMSTGTEGADGSFASGRLAAYVYRQTRNRAFAQRAGAQLSRTIFTTRKVEPPAVLHTIEEAPNVSTNNAAQWSLTAIEVLEMCGDTL